MSVTARAVPRETAEQAPTPPVQSCTVVIFGATGDLTKRMVMPAIFRLARCGLLSPEFRLIGYAPTKLTDAGFRALMRKAVLRDPSKGDKAAWGEFATRLSYLAAGYDGGDLEGYMELARGFAQVDRGAGARRLLSRHAAHGLWCDHEALE